MVYLALNRTSALEAIRVAHTQASAIWVGSDAITEDEHQVFSSKGVNLTRFSYPLAGAESDIVAEALATIREHHPGETIWVQHVAAP
jgi:hypothetical protein